MILEISGVVSFEKWGDGILRIGNNSVVEELEKHGRWRDELVTVTYLHDGKVHERKGRLWYDSDEPYYDEWSPGAEEELRLSPEWDIRQELSRYEGEFVTLWIADEPVDTSEDRDVVCVTHSEQCYRKT